MKVRIRTKDLVSLLTSDLSYDKFMAKYNLDINKVKKIERKLRNSKWRID